MWRIVKTDDMFIQEWLGKFPGSMNTYTDGTIYVTEKGEKVRSSTLRRILQRLLNTKMRV